MGEKAAGCLFVLLLFVTPGTQISSFFCSLQVLLQTQPFLRNLNPLYPVCRLFYVVQRFRQMKIVALFFSGNWTTDLLMCQNVLLDFQPTKQSFSDCRVRWDIFYSCAVGGSAWLMGCLIRYNVFGPRSSNLNKTFGTWGPFLSLDMSQRPDRHDQPTSCRTRARQNGNYWVFCGQTSLFEDKNTREASAVFLPP